jgi:replication factor C subunit 3/5
VLQFIANKQSFELPQAVAQNISAGSDRNLRKAIMMLQAVALKTSNKIKANTAIPVPEYETFLKQITNDLFVEQSPRQLRSIRSKVYELLTKGITSEIIFQQLVKNIMVHNRKPKDPSFQRIVLKYACLFEHRCKHGSKAIMHIEAF